MPERWRGRAHLLALISYGLLALILTYPLFLHLSTHVPGDGIDDPALTWNLWWVRYALLDLHQSPFDCQWMFWPIGLNLAFYTLTVLNGLLSIPLQLGWSVVPASNLLLLSSFVLSGYGAYLLTLEIQAAAVKAAPRAGYAAAWFAGVVYAFASNKLFYAALGQFNIASSQWIPFTALYMWRAGSRRGTRKDAVLAGLFWGLQAWSEATFASFLLLFFALYGLWRLTQKDIRTQWSWYLRMVGSGLVFAIVITPMLLAMLPDLSTQSDLLTQGGGFADVFSADLAGFLIPTMHHPLASLWSDRLPFPHDKGQQIYIGYVVLALSVIGLKRRPGRASTFWWAIALGALLLSLGPTVRVLGRDTQIPGPFQAVASLPFFEGNRYPSRYAVMLLLAASILAASGAYRLMQNRPRRAAPTVALLTVLFLAEHVSIPLPLSDMRVPSIYQQIAPSADPVPGAVLEVPSGWRNGARVVGKKHTIIMFEQWYQTVHQRPILGGNTSRNPEFKFQYFSEGGILDFLIAMVNAQDVPQHEALRAEVRRRLEQLRDPGELATERKAAIDLVRLLNIRYVVVHREHVTPDVETYIAQVFPVELTEQRDGIALYRVNVETQPPREISIGSDAGHWVLGAGWSPAAPVPDGTGRWAAWALRRKAELLIPTVEEITAVEILAYAPGPGQVVTLRVDGRPVARATLSEREWQWIRLDASMRRRAPGVQRIELTASRLFTFEDVYAAIAPSLKPQVPGFILVRSAGEEGGNFAHIYVNGQEASPNQRGYNLVEVDPTTFSVVRADSFDTHGSSEASERMAAWLQDVAPGHWIVGAVKDEASLNLTEAAVVGLRDHGVRSDIRGRFRWSHAFVSGVEDRDLKATEEVHPYRPAQIVIGLPLSEPQAAIGIAAIRLVP
ncbi:MAG: interleukin-like EMT inducer domain-containing protein [Anaerolineae bacterium]